MTLYDYWANISLYESMCYLVSLIEVFSIGSVTHNTCRSYKIWVHRLLRSPADGKTYLALQVVFRADHTQFSVHFKNILFTNTNCITHQLFGWTKHVLETMPSKLAQRTTFYLEISVNSFLSVWSNYSARLRQKIILSARKFEWKWQLFKLFIKILLSTDIVNFL